MTVEGSPVDKPIGWVEGSVTGPFWRIETKHHPEEALIRMPPTRGSPHLG
jgi:hypothetical protein